MLTTNTPLFVNQPIITPDEYRGLKRQLFDARRQYSAVLHALRTGATTVARRKKARRLENRISGLELRLAFSTVDVPDDEPIRLLDALYRWLAVWWAATKEFAAVRFKHAERQHLHL